MSLADENLSTTTKQTSLKNQQNSQRNSEPINVVSTRSAATTMAGSPISSPRSLNESHSLSRLLSKDDDPLLYKELVRLCDNFVVVSI